VGFLLWLVLAVGTAVLAVVRSRGRGRRAAALRRLAEALGLGYAATDVLDERWEPFRLLAMGSARGIENVLFGPVEGADVRAFDYWYRYGVDRESRLDMAVDTPIGLAAWIGLTRRFSCAVGGLPASCPRLLVEPKRFRDRVMELAAPPVPLESERVMRRFHVQCEDPRFAVAFLDPRVMDALLALPRRPTLALCEDRLLLVSRQLSATSVIRLLHQAGELVHAAPRVLASLYPLRQGFRPQDERPDPTIRSAVDRLLLGRSEHVVHGDTEPREQG
jgi:hypothetical protein